MPVGSCPSTVTECNFIIFEKEINLENSECVLESSEWLFEHCYDFDYCFQSQIGIVFDKQMIQYVKSIGLER